MTFGVVESGFVKMQLDDIVEETSEDLKDQLGKSINLLPTSLLGQLMLIMSLREANLWDKMEGTYASQFGDSAGGVSLDNILFYLNMERNAAIASTVVLKIFGDNGTVIPQGFQAKIDGTETAIFSTNSATIIVGTEVEIAATCINTGAIQALATTIDTIVTPVFGVTSVTNDLDAVLGRVRESDADVRIRKKEVIEKTGTATPDKIRLALQAVDDVTNAFIIENVTSTIDVDGRPPKSYEPIVAGGDVQEIGDSLWSTKPTGIETVGDVAVNVLDSEGVSHVVNFSRPEDVLIYLIINIVPNTDPAVGPIFPAGGSAAVKTEVLAYALATYNIGLDIINNGWYSPINTIEGIIGIEVFQGVAPAPTSEANITIDRDQAPLFDSTRITVNEV